MKRPNVFAVACGDPAGVGPVISLRAAAKLPDNEFLLFGSGEQLSAIAEADNGLPANVSIHDVGSVPERVRVAHGPSSEGGAHQLAALEAAFASVRNGECCALVTGPVSKEAIVSAGHAFIGQTEFLARASGLADDAVTMMFLGERLRVALVTTHLAIAEVPAQITRGRVKRTIVHMREALERLSVQAPRILVCGLNPHAGEHGLFGTEDQARIKPSVDEEPCAQGPIPSEAAFRFAIGKEDTGVVAMFHDQATIASKLVDWGNAVNVTWGLPFIRTSVDHGVAYEAARSGNASDDGMVAAMRLAIRLAQSSPSPGVSR